MLKLLLIKLFLILKLSLFLLVTCIKLDVDLLKKRDIKSNKKSLTIFQSLSVHLIF